MTFYCLGKGGLHSLKKGFIIIGIVILALFIIGLLFWFAFSGGVVFSNPTKPAIKSSEFNFTLKYEIGGGVRNISDTLVCEFDGFNIDEGRGKTRKWKQYYKYVQNNELFNYSDRKTVYKQIILQNIEQYKIVLAIASAEYFMGDPDYKGTPKMPYIQVYDTSIGYYKDSKQSDLFLDENGFRIIEWYCDPPIKNTFK